MKKIIGNYIFPALFQAVQWFLPSLAARWAIGLWFTPFPNHLRPEQLRLPEGALKEQIPIAATRYREGLPHYVKYSWGEGPPVLLVHGWGGRGAQMSGFVVPLLAAGYQVISYDALAHGDAPRGKTDVMEMSRVIEDIARQTGGFHAIIAHSLGATASMLAMEAGVSSGKLVTIGAPTSVEYMLEKFARMTGANPRTVAAIREYLEREFQRSVADFSPANIAASLGVAGLILHDRHDKEVSHQQGVDLAVRWPDSEFVTTEGLGHQRILSDPSIIARVTRFVSAGLQGNGGGGEGRVAQAH